MLINFSNHPAESWADRQKTAAEIYGDIIDMPFPDVPAKSDESEISNLAEESIDKILDMLNQSTVHAVMVQGEFTLTYAVVKGLLENGVTVISACGDRKVTETTDAKGKLIKHVEFEFERFREYG